MSRPYDCLPIITQEIVDIAAGYPDQANIDYLRGRQPTLSQKTLQPRVGEYGADGQLHLNCLGLLYRAIDVSFSKDVGQLLDTEQLPSISPPELHVDNARISSEGVRALELVTNLTQQQETVAESGVLDKHLLDKWRRESDPLFSEATRVYAFQRTMVTGGFMLWLADKAAVRFVLRRTEY